MFTVADIPPLIADAEYRTTVPLSLLDRWLAEYRDSSGIDLDPDFQRGHAWDDETRTRYIEHLLRGGRSGRDLYWNCPNHSGSRGDGRADLPPTMTIVDGKQRLTAVTMFAEDQVTVFGGHVLSGFDREARIRAVGATGTLRLQMHVHSLTRRRDVLRWYLDINEGHVAHAPEELARVRGLLREAEKA